MKDRSNPRVAAALRRTRASLLVAGLTALSSLGIAASPASGTFASNSSPLYWYGTAIGTGSADGETTAVDGINGDTFTLTVLGTPADWVGKSIKVTLSWTNPINDYDLYIHQGSNSGTLISSSGNGAPDTTEVAAISPADTGVGVYTVHIVYFTNTPGLDQPLAEAQILTDRRASYLKGGIGFSANSHNTSPGSNAVTEPANRTDKYGNHYTSGIHGFPAGCDLWYYDLRPGSSTFDPNMRNPQYRGMPDAFTNNRQDVEAGGDGGGDVDLAVSPDGGATNTPKVAFVSLIAANISSSTSNDLGKTWQQNQAGNGTGGPVGDDRQWIEYYGPSTVYLLYRTANPAIGQLQKSTDGGLTFGPAVEVGQIGQVGGITVDQTDGTVYCAGSSGVVAVGRPDPITGNITSFTTHAAAADANGVAHDFFTIKCAKDETVYCCYSNDHNIYVVYSKDHGVTWSNPLRISDGPDTVTSVFPWIACGDQPGSIGVVWYGTSDPVNDDNANWNVFYADCKNVTTNCPVIRQVIASDHVVHCGNISEFGLQLPGQPAANRNLGDYFQVSFDPSGAAVIGYCDDHNDFAGNCYSTRQITGMSINGPRLKKQSEGSALPPAPSSPSPDGAQVVDARDDVTDALLGVIPQDDPIDILSIKYSNETSSNGDKVIVAKMTVSTLQNLQPNTGWRMNFAVNAPNSTINGTNLYTNGLSDRGDMFYVRAVYGNGSYTYTFGTAVRNHDGSITNTDQGTADWGLVDPATNSITVKVSASKLNPFVTHGPPIGAGTIMTGLRGFSYTTVNSNARNDITPGGTQYTIQ